MSKATHHGNGKAHVAAKHPEQTVVDPSSITVDPELQRLVPQQRKSEVALLERSLQEEKGCREAVHVWDQEGKLILLDGHTRRELCIKLGFQVPIRKVELESKEVAKAYVKKVQLGRRNMPDHAESYLRGAHYNEVKGTRGGDRRSKVLAATLVDTAEELAKEYEVSTDTIKRDGAFAARLDKVLEEAGMEDKRWQLLGGDVRLNRGAVKKLAELKGRELKRQLEYVLKEGRLPRKKTEKAGSPKEVAKSRAETFLSKLQAKDAKLPLAVLKEMAALLGFKLVEAGAAKKGAKQNRQATR